MPLSINTLDLLNHYINGVMERADHHANNVNEIVLTLAGAVVWKATEDIQVRTYNDETANVLWLIVGQNKYAFTYNHQTQMIDLRERTQQGNVIGSFSNQSTANQVKQVFEQL